MAVHRPYRFGAVMEETYRVHRRRARDRSREHAQKFADDWRSRFGDHTRIWGDEAGGEPEPLSERTIQARFARGYFGLEMLDDPSLPHVASLGQIKNSITVEKQRDVERGWATDIRYEVTTSHPIFPLNEYGIGAPQRMTLEPARVEVASKFRNEAVEDFGAAIDETARKFGAKK